MLVVVLLAKCAGHDLRLLILLLVARLRMIVVAVVMLDVVHLHQVVETDEAAADAEPELAVLKHDDDLLVAEQVDTLLDPLDVNVELGMMLQLVFELAVDLVDALELLEGLAPDLRRLHLAE